ncbi:MAG: glycoside hydrolase [Candidatus Sumerlaeota bacterium]|nr:glycoside hydrolase [Candidatus Sumerlaeota bacterium]
MAIFMLSPQDSFAQAEKRIYIAPDDHTDYMWSGNEAVYQQAFLEMLDYYLKQADETAGESSAYRSRWNCDGSFWLWVYEKNRTPEQFKRLIERIRDGSISAPMNPLVQALGGAPAEAILRGMYYAGSLERRHGLKFEMANEVENQTLPCGLAALWAGAGARYSWKGICGCASRTPAAGDREHDIYWWTAPDGSRLLMKWNSLYSKNDSLGGYAEARDPAAAIRFVESNPAFKRKYPYSVIGIFGKGWDDLKTLTDEFPRVAKAQTTANRQVIVSNMLDFFRDFEATHGASLPSLCCSFGNEWELLSASLAEVTADIKRSTEKLRAAEALATLVALKRPDFMKGREAERDQAWMSLGLYWEHDWTADGKISRKERAAWQRRQAAAVRKYVDRLHDDAARALAAMIPASAASVGRRFYAFNALSWKRDAVADIPYDGPGGEQVIDLTTKQVVPSQIIARDEKRFLRILARDVPAVGYRVYEILIGNDGRIFSPAATTRDGVIKNSAIHATIVENTAVRVTVSPRGSILSLVDKTRSNREFVRQINGLYANDLGGDDEGTLKIENAGPVSVTLLAESAAPLSHRTRITLVRDSGRVWIENQITQNFSDVRAWAFGFNIESPDVWHEEVGAVIRARLLADGGHYSPRQARYDWLTLNHYADMSGGKRSKIGRADQASRTGQAGGTGEAGVTLSNTDCAFMRLGASDVTRLDTATPQISALIGGQVDGRNLGIRDQDGDSLFTQRFALETHGAYDPVAAMRFALEHQNPFVCEWLATAPTNAVSAGSAGDIKPQPNSSDAKNRTDPMNQADPINQADVKNQADAKNPANPNTAKYPETSFSLLAISDPNMLLWALKPAEDGTQADVAIRVWNVSHHPTSSTLSSPSAPIARAHRATHLEILISETAIQNGALPFSAAAQQMQTFLVSFR